MPGAISTAKRSKAMPSKVVIVGAGFGGLWAAKTLTNAPVEVVVIDRQNYHLFQPLLYQVATAGLSPADIAAPIRSIVGITGNISVMLGTVEGVDVAAREVLLERGRRVPYDHLVLASGARHAYFGHDGPEQSGHQEVFPVGFWEFSQADIELRFALTATDVPPPARS